MTTKAKLKNNEDKGEGHRAHFSAILKAKIEIDGKKQEFNIDYDVTITFEQIDYVVRQIAGGIAQAAGRFAKDGLTSREPAENAVA